MNRSLNLDSNFIPTTLPEIEYNLFQFSGGEWHIKLNNNIQYEIIQKVVITTRIRTGEDIIKLLITKDALQLKGVKQFELVMPYIPYARQDRQCYEGESFSLKVFCNLINSLKFDKVIVFDSHSDVAPALLDNCKNISNEEFIRDTILADFKEKPVLISPDAGSNKKSNKLAISLELELVKCDKIRDTKTGQLSGFEVFTDNLFGKECLIVDDICDGGGTFIGLAQELKKKNCGDLYLFTTHGIYSKGIEMFKDIFKVVYCTNSFSTINDPFIKQIKIYL